MFIFVAGFGVISNILNLVILLGKGYFKQHSINVYFIAISVADLCHLTGVTYDVLRRYEMLMNSLFPAFMTMNGVCFTFGFILTFGKGSVVLLTNAVTWERQIAVCDPFKVKLRCTYKNAYKVGSDKLLVLGIILKN